MGDHRENNNCDVSNDDVTLFQNTTEISPSSSEVGLQEALTPAASSSALPPDQLERINSRKYIKTTTWRVKITHQNKQISIAYPKMGDHRENNNCDVSNDDVTLFQNTTEISPSSYIICR
ncbi:hypothetical protein SFRURICE_007896 [Spodoptera frugiperda]|nr:hypothetical protein SFRURICE_007896 [Spodoptera frugiperda]